MTIEKALIYIRVSTDEQATEGRYSPQTQIRICESAILDSEYELATEGIYEDPGKTATNMNRPGLQDLLIRVQDDKSIGAVYVQDTDRLARNVKDHFVIKSILKKHDVKLVSVSQPGIEGDVEGEMLDGILAVVNQFQSQLTGRKTKKSMEVRFRNGWYPTKAPLGYLNAPDPDCPDKNIIIVDKDKGPLITKLFDLYASGMYSMVELRDQLYKEGLVAYRGKKPSRSKMFSIIESSFYYGKMIWGGLEGMGKHPLLTTKETYDRCQKVRAEHNKFACRKRKHNFLLRGFIFSAETGMRYTAEKNEKKNKSYYRCYSGNPDMVVHESDKFIPTDTLEEEVEERFYAIQFSDTFIERVTKRIKHFYSAKQKQVKKQQSLLEGRRENLEKRLEIAEQKLISGILADSDYIRIRDGVRKQMSDVEDQLLEVRKSRNIQVDVIQQILKLIRNIGDTYSEASPELKRLYLGLFWKRFEVSEREIVNAIPSKIVKALVLSGSIVLDKRQKPVQVEQAFADKSLYLRSGVKIKTAGLRGRDSNLRPAG